MTCHSIWMYHNKENHEENYYRPNNQYEVINKQVQDYASATIVALLATKLMRQIRLINWTLPLKGWVKSNSDEACLEDGRAGCGNKNDAW